MEKWLSIKIIRLRFSGMVLTPPLTFFNLMYLCISLYVFFLFQVYLMTGTVFCKNMSECVTSSEMHNTWTKYWMIRMTGKYQEGKSTVG